MITENMLPALIGALVGGVVTILGWIFNYYLGRSKDIELHQREARIRYIQQQIEELYAPVMSLIEQSRIVHEVARQRIPSRPDGSADREKFKQQDKEVYRYFNENYYLPLNGQISEIIQKKVYLMRDGVMPDSFNQFLQHYILNESMYRLWKEKNIDSTNLIPGVAYPVNFGADVKSALDELRQQYLIEIALLSKTKRKSSKG